MASLLVEVILVLALSVLGWAILRYMYRANLETLRLDTKKVMDKLRLENQEEE